VSPVPPFLPIKQVKSGGHAAYAIGLLVVAAALAILFVPLDVELFGLVFGIQIAISPLDVAGVVLTTVLGPLAAGLLGRRLAPAFATRIAHPVTLTGMILVVVALVPVLFVSWRGVVAVVGDGTLLAMVAFIAVGLAVGHFLGGAEPSDRLVLALATATRHPGV